MRSSLRHWLLTDHDTALPDLIEVGFDQLANGLANIGDDDSLTRAFHTIEPPVRVAWPRCTITRVVDSPSRAPSLLQRSSPRRYRMRRGTWMPLHLFFVGSLASAISTVTQMLAVTWSASPAPPRAAVVLQRWGLAVGTILVVVGRATDQRSITVSGAVLVGASLALVGAILIDVRRNVRTTRFIPAIDAYLLAFGAAAVGIGLGLQLATGAGSSDMRNAHLLLNLLAFVGVVIAATIPYFVATQARLRMSPRATPARVRATTMMLWTAAVLAASAAGLGHRDLTAVALLCYGVGVAAVATLLPRLQRKNLEWAGPRLVQLLAGLAWWAAMVVWAGIEFRDSDIDRTTLAALAIGGFGQILAASFAYLVPVARGGGHALLSAGFRRTRSWLGLALGNLAAVSAFAGHERLMTIVVCAWLIDAALRTATR